MNIFISFSSNDQTQADKLYQRCQDLNFDTWFAPVSISIGENYAGTISDAIKNCDYFLLILSVNSAESRHVKREIGLALKYNKKIFPIKIDNLEIVGDIEYFLEGVQWVEAGQNYEQSVDALLNSLLLKETQINEVNLKTLKPTTKKQFKLVEEVEDIERYLSEAIKIDEQYYHEDLVGQFDICMAWYNQDENIYTFVVDENDKVVGYINSMLVDQDTFNAILNGNFIDNDIPNESLVQAFMPGIYRMYFCSVAIDQQQKKEKNKIFKLLYQGFFQKLYDLAQEGCFIEELVADAVTHDGKNLAESFGMEVLTMTDHDSRIFYTKLIPPKFRFYDGITHDVFKLYKDYYQNYHTHLA